MTWVTWSHDSDKTLGYFMYFTQGTVAQQMEQAKAFAKSQRIDPEQGFLKIRTDGRDQRKTLLQRWLSEGREEIEYGTVCGNPWCRLKHEFHMECERENAQ